MNKYNLYKLIDESNETANVKNPFKEFQSYKFSSKTQSATLLSH